MTTVAIDTNYKGAGFGSSLSAQAYLTGQFKQAIVEVTFGAGENYATGGVTADLSADGQIKRIIGGAILSGTDGHVVEVIPGTADDAATSKLKFYSAAATELGAANAATNSLVVKILVIGF